MATSWQCSLPDEELTALGDSVPFSDTRPLAKALGIGDVDFDQIQRQYPQPVYTILKQWTREQFHEGDALRNLLAEKLAEAGLRQQSIRLLNGEFSISGRAASKGLGEDLLISLAEGIEQEEHEVALGRTLGFNVGKLKDFQETNRLTGRKTKKGTIDMLLEWRQKISPYKQYDEMRKALLKAGLHYLADLHFGTRPNILYVQITPTMTFQYCIDIMRNHYKTVLCKLQRLPWDPHDYVNFDQLYTEIHLLQYDNSTGQILRVPFNGTVNQIMNIEKEGESCKRFLLLAPGGYGKTCAIAKMAYDWAYEVEGSPMKDIPALFALHLRKVHDDMGLGDAIISQLLGIIPGFTSENLEDIIGLHENECALLCDGYDEYAKSIRDMKSKNSLVEVLQHKRLKNCQVLVTSRPFLEDDFLHENLSRVYIKIYGKGYTPQLAHQYISRYFEAKSVAEEAENLLRFLTENCFLAELIAVPFFCTMICHLHEIKALSDTHTWNSLFRALNIFLFQHANAKNKELPEEVKILDSILNALGKVALKGLLRESRKLVFEDHDFGDCKDAYEKGLMLGILSKTANPVKYVDHDAVSKKFVEFSHMWQQEYCASLYLQNPRPVGNRFSTIQRNFSRMSQFRSLRRTNELPLTLQTLLDVANSPKKIIEFENIFRLLAASGNIRVCQTVFSHVTHVDWKDGVKDQGYTSSDKCRLILNCVSETDTRYVTGSVAQTIRKCFNGGKLSLENTTTNMISGIQLLPSGTKITKVEITRSCLTPRLLRSLASLEGLSILDVRDIGSVRGSSQECITQLPSIKEFHAFWVEPNVLLTLSRCMTAVEVAEIRMRLDIDAVEEDMSAITGAVKVMGGTLKSLKIFAPSDVGIVSAEAGQQFGRVIADAAGHLETLIVWFLQMSETGMMDIVKSCQQAARIEDVKFLDCESIQRTGDLCKFLDGISRQDALTKRPMEIRILINKDSWMIPRVQKLLPFEDY